VKTAVSCGLDTANDVRHQTGDASGLFMHPLIGTPPFSNVTVPEGEPPLVTVAGNHTASLVTGVVSVADSEVALGANPTVRGALPDAEPSVAVIVNCPGVELVMVVLQLPPAPVVQPGALTPPGLDEKVMPSPGGTSMPASVAWAVARLVELPSATIMLGDNVRVMVSAPTAAAGPASPNQLTAVASTTSPQIEPRVKVLSGLRLRLRRPTQCLILRNSSTPNC
jgi:hypothetical protein